MSVTFRRVRGRIIPIRDQSSGDKKIEKGSKVALAGLAISHTTKAVSPVVIGSSLYKSKHHWQNVAKITQLAKFSQRQDPGWKKSKAFSQLAQAGRAQIKMANRAASVGIAATRLARPLRVIGSAAMIGGIGYSAMGLHQNLTSKLKQK